MRFVGKVVARRRLARKIRCRMGNMLWIVAVPSGIAFDVCSDVRYRLLQRSVAHPAPGEEHERCLECVSQLKA